jgi:hypothetical protein
VVGTGTAVGSGTVVGTGTVVETGTVVVIGTVVLIGGGGIGTVTVVVVIGSVAVIVSVGGMDRPAIAPVVARPRRKRSTAAKAAAGLTS